MIVFILDSVDNGLVDDWLLIVFLDIDTLRFCIEQNKISTPRFSLTWVCLSRLVISPLSCEPGGVVTEVGLRWWSRSVVEIFLAWMKVSLE